MTDPRLPEVRRMELGLLGRILWPLHWLRDRILLLPPEPAAYGPILVASIEPAPIAKPRRKGLGPKQLKWLRAHSKEFRDMEARAKASKLAGAK